MSEIRLTITKWEQYNPRSNAKSHSWFRLNNDFFSNHRSASLSPSAKLFWIYLLTLASNRSKPNINLQIPVATKQTGVRSSQALAALRQFIAFGWVALADDCKWVENSSVKSKQKKKKPKESFKADVLRTNEQYEQYEQDIHTPISAIAEVSEPRKQFHPIVQLWNETVQEPLSKAIKCDGKRLKAAKACWSAIPDISFWREAIEKINDSDFCRGLTKKSTWKASVDWLLNVENATKVVENNYVNAKDAEAFKVRALIAEIAADESANDTSTSIFGGVASLKSEFQQFSEDFAVLAKLIPKGAPELSQPIMRAYHKVIGSDWRELFDRAVRKYDFFPSIAQFVQLMNEGEPTAKDWATQVAAAAFGAIRDIGGHDHTRAREQLGDIAWRAILIEYGSWENFCAIVDNKNLSTLKSQFRDSLVSYFNPGFDKTSLPAALLPEAQRQQRLQIEEAEKSRPALPVYFARDEEQEKLSSFLVCYRVEDGSRKVEVEEKGIKKTVEVKNYVLLEGEALHHKGKLVAFREPKTGKSIFSKIDNRQIDHLHELCQLNERQKNTPGQARIKPPLTESIPNFLKELADHKKAKPYAVTSVLGDILKKAGVDMPEGA